MAPDQVPAGWREATYGDVLAETEERAGERLDLPVLSVTKTRGPMLASERFGKVLHSRDLSRYRVAHRDVIVADPMLLWDGSIGIQRVVDAGLVSPDYRVYAPAEGTDPAFLAYVVRSPTMLPHYQGGARGTNVRRNRIARSDFLAIPLPLPPLCEQRRIAAILSSVDGAIETTQAVIDQLGVLKKAMMVELLTRGRPGRYSRFKRTEIGLVPEEWKLVELQEVVVDGPTNGLYKPAHLIGRGALVAGMTAIDRATLDWSLCRRAELDAGELERFGLRQNDLLVTRVYANVEGIGRFVVVPALVEPVGYESNMMRLRLDDQQVLPEFVAAHMALPELRKGIEQRATLGVQASINNEGVRKLPLRLPALEEQREVVRALESIERRLGAEGGVVAGLRAAKTALTSALLTGQVRVKLDEEAA